MPTFAIKTIGCKLNQFESEAIAYELIKNGLSLVSYKNKADIYIINTCTVTAKSDAKSRHAINHIIKNNPHARVIITGCYAQTDYDYLTRLYPEAIVIKNENKPLVVDVVMALFEGREPVINNKVNPFAYKIDSYSFHVRAFVKIQDGCNNKCIYCKTRIARGRSVSRDYNSIIEEIKKLIDHGYKEFVLTGLNIADYNYNGVDIAELLEMILKLNGNFRLHLSSLEPDLVNDRIIKLFESPKVVKHIHLPAQSLSDKILRLMRRNYTSEYYLKLISKIKDKYPDINLTGDIIIGFFNETDSDFEKTLKAIKWAGFSKVHFFTFSPRFEYKDKKLIPVPHSIVKQRVSKMKELLKELAKSYISSLNGKQYKWLVEGIRDGIHFGYLDNYIMLKRRGDFERNEIYNVVIDTATDILEV